MPSIKDLLGGPIVQPAVEPNDFERKFQCKIC